MASAVFGAVGTALFGPLGGYIGSLAGSMIDNALFAPKQPGVSGPRLSDLQAVSADPGSTIPLVFGTARLTVSLVAAGTLIERKRTSTVGGKGGGSTSGQEVTEYSYFANLDYLMCAGPILGIGRVWADGELIRGPSNSEEIIISPALYPTNAGALNYPTRYSDNAYNPSDVPKSLNRNVVDTWDGNIYRLNDDKDGFDLIDPFDFTDLVDADTLLYWKDTSSGYYIPCLETHGYEARRNKPEQCRTWEDYYNFYDAINDYSSASLFSLKGCEDFSIYFGKDEQDTDPTMAAALSEDVPAYNGRAHIVFNELNVTSFGGRPPALSVEVVQSDTLTVIDVIDYFMEEANVSTDMYDTTDLQNEGAVGGYVMGYVIKSDSSYRAGLDSLLDAFNIDATDSGNALTFTRRYSLSELDVNYYDITDEDVVSGNKLSVDIEQSYSSLLNMPKHFYMTYSDPSRGYAFNTAHAARHISTNDGLAKTEVAAVLIPPLAKLSASLKLRDVWLAASTLKFSLPYRYFYIKPGNRVRIRRDGTTVMVLKVISVSTGANGMVNVEGVRRPTHEFSLGSAALTVYGDNPAYIRNSYVENNLTDTEIMFLDVPPLSPLQPDVFGVNFAFYTAEDALDSTYWPSATIFYRSEDVDDYTRGDELSDRAVVGTVVSGTLGSANPNTVDTSSVITVELHDSSRALSSVTDAQFFNNVNVAMIGDEIVAYKFAELVAPKRYELSTFIRGIKAVDFSALDSHESAESFTQLTEVNTQFIEQPLTKLDVDIQYKAVTTGNQLSEAESLTYAIKGNILKPLPVVMVERTGTIESGVVIEWHRQDRRVFDWVSFGRPVMSEDDEEYLVEILDDEGEVLRSTILNTNSFLYTLDMQVVDGTNPTNSLKRVRISQMSALVGAGHPTTEYV